MYISPDRQTNECCRNKNTKNRDQVPYTVSFMSKKSSFAYKPKYKKSNGGAKSGIAYNEIATYLVIVESPSKCKKIEDYLGEKYQCIASKGHIREIDGLKSIQSKDKYQISFSPINEKRDHVNKMREIISHFDKQNIFLATDDDREGEAIAWHICDVFDLPVLTTKRILFHEITNKAILIFLLKVNL